MTKAKTKRGEKSEASTVGVYVSADELNLMKRAAKHDGRTLSSWCRRMIFIGLNTVNMLEEP